MAHWWSVADRCRPRLIDGNATFTTDTSRITITWAAIIRPKVVHGRRGSSAGGHAGWWTCEPGAWWVCGSTGEWADICCLLVSGVVGRLPRSPCTEIAHAGEIAGFDPGPVRSGRYRRARAGRTGLRTWGDRRAARRRAHRERWRSGRSRGGRRRQVDAADRRGGRRCGHASAAHLRRGVRVPAGVRRPAAAAVPAARPPRGPAGPTAGGAGRRTRRGRRGG